MYTKSVNAKNPQKHNILKVHHIMSTLTLTCSIIVNAIDKSALILFNLRVREIRSKLAMCNHVCHQDVPQCGEPGKTV
jgi:hypothetical protein